jgi:hypothetical protein
VGEERYQISDIREECFTTECTECGEEKGLPQGKQGRAEVTERWWREMGA